jgi:hypothetical protein
MASGRERQIKATADRNWAHRTVENSALGVSPANERGGNAQSAGKGHWRCVMQSHTPPWSILYTSILRSLCILPRV